MNKGSVAIVGVGAVGKMLAYFLRTTGVPSVICYGRRGVEVLSGRVSFRDQSEVFRTDRSGERPDLWLIATKAYDTVSALEQWLPVIASGTPVVLLCNGFIEPALVGIRKQFPHHQLRKGVVSRGARTLIDGTLALSSEGEIVWGSTGPATPFEGNMFKALASKGFVWDPNVCRIRKEKWFCNTVLNTLCGAYGLSRNSDVKEQMEFDGLCHEVYELGLKYWPEWQGQSGELKQKLLTLIAKTADNENSMAVDVRLRRRTEADFLSGHILRFENPSARFPLLYNLHQRIIEDPS